MDEVAQSVCQLGTGTELAKADVKAAYRLVPVHPHDRPLLAMQWQGNVYIDTALPFGLRSAQKLFNAVADALEWCAKKNGAQLIWHYLDDFIMVGRAGTGECGFSNSVFHHVCGRLGVPLAVDKCEGPCTRLFWGIEIDSMAMEMRLPRKKLMQLKGKIAVWQTKRSYTKRELQSIIGLLQHAATVVRPGRTFLRRLYDLLAITRAPHHHIRLNAEAHSDLSWWSLFLESWNGVSIMAHHPISAPLLTVVSDASGHWGCGAYHKNEWLQLSWSGFTTFETSIMVKALVPLVAAVALWGKQWTGSTIMCKWDNVAVVTVIGSRTSRNKAVMHLLRCLFFLEASFDCHLLASHIPGVQNELADDLSRNRLTSFLQKAPPSMSPTPCLVPQYLRDLLFHAIDWTSPSWRMQFANILRQA